MFFTFYTYNIECYSFIHIGLTIKSQIFNKLIRRSICRNINNHLIFLA